MVDQRRFDNQRSPRSSTTAKPAARKPAATSATRGPGARSKPRTDDTRNDRSDDPRSDDTWVSARVAAAFLGIDIRTLYAYVSRGAVRSAAAATGRSRQYLQQDLAKLKARHDARAGHGAVAAAALRWGEPVLDSAITEITPHGPAYRGHLATELARDGVAFERVAELLWQGHLPATDVAWAREAPPNLDKVLRASAGANVMDLMAWLTTSMACADPQRGDTRPDALVRIGRQLIPLLACACSGDRNPAAVAKLLREPSVAHILVAALGAPAQALPTINQALVLLADHELNASSFAARIAASADADGYAIVSAGLAVLSGTGHGAHSLRVEQMLASIHRPNQVATVLANLRQRGLTLPGFGHTLYSDGDPRATGLLASAIADGGKRPAMHMITAVLAHTKTWAKPNVDFALAAMTAAYNLPPGSGVAMFAIGRIAGWIAHAIEQRAAAYLLRPRARYIGISMQPQ